MADRRYSRTERMEFAGALLLVLATVATAWSSYQASRWHGEQAEAQSSATASRLESTRASGVANRESQIDVQLFIQWVDARQQDDRELYALPSPFAMPEYKVSEIAAAERLEGQAAAASEAAKEDIQHADNYVLAVVLCAASLFFGGLSLRLRTDAVRTAILGCGYFLFVAAAIWIATSPVSVSI